MMNRKQFLTKWIAALRSGEYEQGYSQLRKGDTFCCLGVACDISGVGRWRHDRFELGPDKRVTHLPSALSKVLFADDLVTEHEFTVMNDEDGASLSEIADTIEFIAFADGVFK